MAAYMPNLTYPYNGKWLAKSASCLWKYWTLCCTALLLREKMWGGSWSGVGCVYVVKRPAVWSRMIRRRECMKK